VPLRSPDIISDNLDRVAASADQILEVVNKEAGLMVELKRLLAQDAGVSGQILEEADLTDTAVAERLRSELRARVLATRLLQRYGYLVPRLNPDSDLDAEQKLVRQERAQVLARAAERRDSLGETATASRNARCDPRSVPDCALPSSLGEDRENLPRARLHQRACLVHRHPSSGQKKFRPIRRVRMAQPYRMTNARDIRAEWGRLKPCSLRLASR